MKDLTARNDTTICTISLHQAERTYTSKNPLETTEELQNRDDIVVTKLDSFWVKSEYPEASINDTTKFRPFDTQRPKTSERPVKYYHLLLQPEKKIGQFSPPRTFITMR